MRNFFENILMGYCGLFKSDIVYGMADLLKSQLEIHIHPAEKKQTAFAIFIEQINNIIMHSQEKEDELPKGSFVLGERDGNFFIQTSNAVTHERAEFLRTRIEQINKMEKNELFRFYKNGAKSKNTNTESKGAGIGLYEMAWRSAEKFEYELSPRENNMIQFNLCVTI
jgi:hypothetical protein